MRRNLFTVAMLFLVSCLAVVPSAYGAENSLMQLACCQLRCSETTGALLPTQVQLTSSPALTRNNIDPLPDPPFPRPKPVSDQAPGGATLMATNIDPLPDPPFPRPKPVSGQALGSATLMASNIDPLPDPPFPRPKPVSTQG